MNGNLSLFVVPMTLPGSWTNKFYNALSHSPALFQKITSVIDVYYIAPIMRHFSSI